MKLNPLHDWAVLIPTEASNRTAGGLYIPDTAQKKPEEGIVEAIGPGAYEEEKHGRKKEENKERKFIPTTVKPGDRVLYEGWSGKTHTIGSEERVIVRERDILGWIERTHETTAISVPKPTPLAQRPVPMPPQKVDAGLAGTSVKAKPKTAATGKSSTTKTAAKKAGPAKKKAASKPAKKKAAKSKSAKGGKAGKKK